MASLFTFYHLSAEVKKASAVDLALSTTDLLSRKSRVGKGSIAIMRTPSNHWGFAGFDTGYMSVQLIGLITMGGAAFGLIDYLFLANFITG